MFVDLFLIFKCDFNLLMSHVSARIIKPFFKVVVFFYLILTVTSTCQRHDKVLYFLGVIWVHFRRSKTKFDIKLKERKFTRSDMVFPLFWPGQYKKKAQKFSFISFAHSW